MEQEKKNSNLLTIILVCIIVILAICCVVLFVKNKYLDEKYDDNNINTSNTNNINNINTTNNYRINTNNNADKNTVDTNSNYITEEEAINIALKDININRNEVYDLDVELERKYNATVYEVNFDYNYLEYEYYINAIDGSILKSFSERD